MNGVAIYKWTLGDRMSHCGACVSLDGEIKTMDEWSMCATPPLHAGCGCHLQFAGWEERPEPDTPPQPLPNPGPPPGIAGEIPFSPPVPQPLAPVYPPGTPPATRPR